MESGDSHWMARLEIERQHVAGPFYIGGRVSLEGEGTERMGVCSNRVQLAPTAGVRFDAGPARVRIGAGLPALGVLARPGRTALHPDLLDTTWSSRVQVPAALYATGPWNAPAVDLTGRASWAVPTGEAWVAVRTTVDRLDVDLIERRVTTVQPEVGFRWGGRPSNTDPSARRSPPLPPVVLPPAEAIILVPPGVAVPDDLVPTVPLPTAPPVAPEPVAPSEDPAPSEPPPAPDAPAPASAI